MKTKLSVASKVFEWFLVQWFPADDNAKLVRLRRKIYHPILDAWSSYGYCTCIDGEGCEIEGARMKVMGFVFWMVRGYIHYLYGWSGLALWICKRYGHKLVDLSSAGPESGNMDHGCLRCGASWHVPLY